MVHRDPETGQFVSGSGGDSMDTTYSDLEWYHQRYHLYAEHASGSGTNTYTVGDDRALDTERAPPDGLDSNEVAELVTARIIEWAGVLNTGDVDTEPGMAEYRLGVGFNTHGDEFSVFTPDTDVENSDFIGSGDTSSGAVSIGEPTDDPGELLATYGNVAWPGLDTTNGAGAGAGPVGERREHVLDFSGLDAGPVVDKTDDLTVAAKVDKRQLSNGVRAGFQLHLGYRVHEIEGGRTRLGFPSD